MAKNAKLEELLAKVAALEEANAMLQEKLNAKPTVVAVSDDRKQQTLNALLNGAISTPKIATALNIDARNVGSQLSYLRDDGFAIGKNGAGWHKLEGWSAEFVRHPKSSKKHAAAIARWSSFTMPTAE